MPQISSWTIPNSGGSTYRAAVNSALAAVQSSSSGTAAPSPTVAGMLWYDTTNSILKRRNTANTAWIEVSLDAVGATTVRGNASGSAAAETDVSMASLRTMMGFDVSLAASGYQKLPGGLIMQWGNGAVAVTTGTTFTLPIAFPTAAVSVASSSASGSAVFVNYTGLTTTSFLARAWNSSTGASTNGLIIYIALGY